MAEREYERDEHGRFASTGGGASKGLKAFAEKHASGDPARPMANYHRAMNPEKHGEMARIVHELKSTVEAGKLTPGVNLGQHVKIAKDVLAKHNAVLAETIHDLKALAPADAKVKGRTKELHSALGKLVRKPKYGTVDKLQDATGARVITNSIQKVEQTVDRIKGAYKVVTEDNYVHQPQEGGYRSHHLIIEDKHGLQKEIQVRTQNQNKFADWAHKIYKPETPEKAAVAEKHKDVIQHYSEALSKHLYDADRGVSTIKPTIPAFIKKHFGEVK